MDIYYVDGEKGNDGADGSEGRPWKTLRRALDAPAESEIRVRPGVYRETLVIRKPGKWVGEQGAILDGGYGPATARRSGDSWETLVYRPPAANEVTPVRVEANDVTLDGLTVRNSGSSGISADGVSNLVIRNCHVRHTYGTAIKILQSDGVLIEHCRCNVASVMIFDPTRSGGGPQSVSGVVKTDSRNVVIQDCVFSNGFGEVLNIGKGAKNVCVRRVRGYNGNHKIFYVNRSEDVVFEECVAFNTGDPAHLWHDGEAAAGFAVNDETTKAPKKWGDSKRITWRRCKAVNCGIPWQLTADNATDAGFVFEDNVVVWGPLTRKGVWIGGPQQGVCRNNVFYVSPGAEVVRGNPAGMVFENNRWSIEPPAAWRGKGDSYGGLIVATEMPTAEHDPLGMGEWYEIRPELYGVEPPPDDEDGTEPDGPPPAPETAVILAELREVRARLTDAALVAWNAREAVEAAGARVDELIGKLSVD